MHQGKSRMSKPTIYHTLGVNNNEHPQTSYYADVNGRSNASVHFLQSAAGEYQRVCHARQIETKLTSIDGQTHNIRIHVPSLSNNQILQRINKCTNIQC